MSPEARMDDIVKKRVVYQIPGMDAVTIRRDVTYRAADESVLTMDIYYPPGSKSDQQVPAVILVAGYPDPGFQAMLGCKFKEMGSSISWGQLLASSGLAAIAYTNREPAPDLEALLQYLRHSAVALGIDSSKIGVWASSGNVPLALSILMREDRERMKCAVLCYGFMLDLDGSTDVAEAAKGWGFANPAAGRSIADLPKDLPLFITRAGRDETPHLNETIDRFLARAIELNLPMTFANHALGPHAFDLFYDSETSRQIIRQVLAFLQFHLLT